MITPDATHRFVTDTEKSTWNGKASTAVATQSANGLMSSSDKQKVDKAVISNSGIMRIETSKIIPLVEDNVLYLMFEDNDFGISPG